MTLQAIDVSSNNGRVNFKKLTAPIFISKLSGGASYWFKNNQIKEALKNKKLVGAYHYVSEYKIITNAQTEAKQFYKYFKPFKGSVLPIIDYEEPLNHVCFTFKDIQYLTNILKSFKKLSDINAVIYCSKSFIWNNTITNYIKRNNMVWFAQYANTKPTGYQLNPWTDKNKLDVSIVGQQYTDNGRVNGITGAVDLSIFYITRNNWLKTCK